MLTANGGSDCHSKVFARLLFWLSDNLDRYLSFANGSWIFSWFTQCKSAQSCRCPLCTQAIGNYVIHDIQTRFDYRKHYLTPLRSASSQPLLPPRTAAAIEARNAARRRRRQGEHERQRRQDLNEHDKLELSIAIRRWIYQHELYAKVCTSTTYCF